MLPTLSLVLKHFMIGNNVVLPDSAGELYESIHSLIKNFSGHVEKPPLGNSRFKNLKCNPNFSFFHEGF